MKFLSFKIVLLTLLVTNLFACSQEEVIVEEPVIRPVKTTLVEEQFFEDGRSFPGLVDAVQKAQVSFRIPGKLLKIHVKEGDKVEKGALLAELDPTDYQITLNNRKAIYNRTKADFKRGKELVADGYISRTQYDKMESDFSSAEADYNQAKQDMLYTKLYASFAGTIGKRYVDNFEEVSAKEEIFNLNDVSRVEIKINIPENLLQNRQTTTAHLRTYASFDSMPDKHFPIKLKEMSTKADPQTQTFQATFLMDQPKEIKLYAGMTANVRIEVDSDTILSKFFLVPISAVKGGIDMNPVVFVVQPETNMLKEQAVKVGSMRGSNIEVTEGVNVGDRIVIAGVSFMRDGDKVSLMPFVEQADIMTAP
ncbi:efflux RND transporter periplasmic adaptor subunit [Psychromonas sp. MME2]|uniref:efflux RND transporter periplasmic adaptor subunit n=1 Tax=unclassified Psychromonas TaxID=2614957 RepID=UPI00339BD07F